MEQHEGKRKREDGEEKPEEAKKARQWVLSLGPRNPPVPVEIAVLIWFGWLSAEQREQGLWVLLLVYRSVCKEWRSILQDIWLASRPIGGGSFPGRAAQFGWTALLKWAMTQGWPATPRNTENVLAAAAKGRFLAVMSFIRGPFICEAVVAAAVQGGDEESWKWCLKYSTKKHLVRKAAQAAAKAGNLRYLEARGRKGQISRSLVKSIARRASSQGQIEVVMWIEKEHEMLLEPKMLTRCATCNGHLHLLQWLHAGGRLDMTKAALRVAESKGHSHVLEWWSSLNAQEGK